MKSAVSRLSTIVLLTALGVMGCAQMSNAPQTVVPDSVPQSGKAFADSDDRFTFLVVGDRTGGHRPGVFARAMHQVNYLQPEFVMGVGDLIEGYTEDIEQLDREWSEVEGMIDTLDAPFFYVVGNHDMGNNVMTDIWAERRGDAYYHFVYKDVLFIALNTEDPFVAMDPEMRAGMDMYKKLLKEDPDAAMKTIEAYQRDQGAPIAMRSMLPVNISDEQVASVEHALNAHADVRWTLLFMHKPAWRYDNDNFEKIEALLAQRDYTMVAGHDHYYTHTERHGRDYIGMGTTGGSFHRKGPGDMDHVALITMTPDGPVVANIELGGLHDKTGPAAE